MCIGRVLRSSDEYSGQCEPSVSHRHQECHVYDVRVVGAAGQEDNHAENIQVCTKVLYTCRFWPMLTFSNDQHVCCPCHLCYFSIEKCEKTINEDAEKMKQN